MKRYPGMDKKSNAAAVSSSLGCCVSDRPAKLVRAYIGKRSLLLVSQVD